MIFITSVAIVEIVLTIFGMLILKIDDDLNSTHWSSEEGLNILAIGESTTTNFFAKGQLHPSWSNLLQERFKREKLPINIFTEAKAGTNSAEILKNLSMWLDKYNPDVVISMIGINDSYLISHFSFHTEFCQNLSLKVLKVVCWFRDYFKEFNSPSIIEKSFSKSINKKVWKIAELFRFKEYSLIDKELENLSREEKAYLQMRLTSNCTINTTPSLPDLEFCIKHIMSAYRTFPNENRIIQNYFYVIHRFRFIEPGRHKYLRKELLDKIFESPPSYLDSVTLSLIINRENLNYYGLKFKSLIDKYGYLREKQFLQNKVYANLKKIHSTIVKKGAVHVLMSYPTTSLTEHLGRFDLNTSDERHNIRFVENRENFSEALTRIAYDELFVDRFAGSWGHTSLLGSELIADNLYPLVLEIYESLIKERSKEKGN